MNASSTANRSYVLLRHSNPVHLPNVADITVSPPGCCTLGTPDQEPAQVSIQNMDGKSSSPPNDVITVTAP